MIKNIASKICAAAVSFLVALAMSTPAVAAEGTFTVKQSVAIPHAVLAPGTYTFKQIGTMGAIAVSDLDGHRIAMFLTFPGSHDGNSDKTAITLKDQRVQSIHFAASDIDLEFPYSANSESTSAKNTVQPCSAGTNGL